MPSRTERETEILEAAGRLDAEYRRWLNETADEVPPDDAFEAAVEEFLVVADGDVPASCRTLIEHAAQFGSAWRAYTNGEDGFRQSDWRPTSKVLSPLEAVLRDAKGVETYQPKRPEPIAALLAQGVSKGQIAREIYGRGGVGPFCGPGGNVLEDLLDQESLAQQELKKVRGQLRFADPDSDEGKGLKAREDRILGSMLCGDDWVHPIEREAQERASKEHRRQIAAARESRRVAPKEDPVAMLREGAYVSQIANVCGLTTEQVLELAAEQGIEPKFTPNLASERSPYEPTPSRERLSGAHHATAEGHASTPGEDTEAEDGPDQPAPSAADLAATITLYREQNPDLGAGELAAKIREEEGIEVSVQKVAAVIRQQNQQREHASA